MVACAVIREAQRRGLAEVEMPKRFSSVEEWVEESMWTPALQPVIAREPDLVKV